MPIIVDDLISRRDLIEAIIRHAGGVYLDAKECASGVNTSGKIDAALRKTVVEQLKVRRAGGIWQGVDVSVDKSLVSSTIDGVHAASLSPGMATVCGVATSIFSDVLDGSPLAIIAYNEAELDRDWARVVWNLFTQYLEGRRIGRVHTLVVLIEATKVNYEMHCGYQSSLAYRLSGNRLERRKDWGTTASHIQRQIPREGSLTVLFLGAGFSASSRLPLGDEMRDEALRNLLPNAASTNYTQLVDAFRDYLTSEDRWLSPSERDQPRESFALFLTLERVLREELLQYGFDRSPTLQKLAERNKVAVANPGQAVTALGRMMTREENLVIVTVNFDQLVESNGNCRVFSTEDEFSECPAYLQTYLGSSGAIPVLKLHGTIEKPATIIGTVDAVARGLSEPKTRALNALVELCQPLSWTYIGYSMRDSDVSNILASRPFYQHLDETWVSPFTVETARKFTEEHRVYDRGARTFWQRSITATADVYLRVLADAWRT